MTARQDWVVLITARKTTNCTHLKNYIGNTVDKKCIQNLIQNSEPDSKANKRTTAIKT